MITEWFISIGQAIAQWFLGLFGTDAPPDWITSVAGFVTELFARVAGLGAWLPFPLIGTVGAALLGLWAVFWLIKGIRWLWGLTPFSGGS